MKIRVKIRVLSMVLDLDGKVVDATFDKRARRNCPRRLSVQGVTVELNAKETRLASKATRRAARAATLTFLGKRRPTRLSVAESHRRMLVRRDRSGQ